MLRVLHLTTDGSKIAGAERVILDLQAKASNASWNLHVVTLSPEGPFNASIRARGGTTGSLDIKGMGSLPRGLARLAREVKRFRPHILHVHLRHATAIGTMAKGVIRIPVVQTRHYSNYLDVFGGRLTRFIDRAAAHRCDAVVAVSNEVRSHLITRERLPESRVHLVRNGAETPEASADSLRRIRKELGEIGASEGQLLTCMATFHPRKGHKTLLRAFEKVRKSFPDAKLLLFGDGDTRNAIGEEIRALGLSASVFMLGHRDDARDFLAVSDLYIQPSIEEGFGLAVLEAMTRGVPPIVSDVGGLKEVVADAGIRVPPGDVGALAAAIERLLADETGARRLGEEARSRAMSEFSAQKMVEGYRVVYQSVLRT